MASLPLNMPILFCPPASFGNTTNIYIGGDVKGGTIIAGDEIEVKK